MPHPTARVARTSLVLTALTLLAPGAALAAPAATTAKAPPDIDVRLAAAASSPARSADKATASARASLQRSLGTEGVLDIDAVTGTVRSVSRLSGTLTSAAAGSTAELTRAYAARNATALGLSAADLATLGTPKSVPAFGGLTVVTFPQEYAGIPAFDSELRGATDAEGRLVMVGGSPAHGLGVASTTPKLSAEAALKLVATSVGGQRDPAVSQRAGGATQKTTFADGDEASLVLFETAKGAKLAWDVDYLAGGPTGLFAAVVDAQTGELLHRTSLTDHADATTIYYPRYPDAPHGGSPTVVDLTAKGWLDADAPFLRGPYSRAYSDVDGSDDDSDAKGFDEQVRPGGRITTIKQGSGATGTSGPATTSAPVTSFQYPLVNFNDSSANTSTGDGGNCVPEAPCTWDDRVRTSWQTNRAEATLQSFVYVNNFHDHYAAPPIGFDEASGNFAGDDPVLTESDDGADTEDDGGPGDLYLNNANMSTPPDGQSPRMQMYLGDINQDGLEGLFRDDNNGEDAATVYHEYTHGLTNRLVTTADGAGALGAQQSGSMGEAWSDWYAFDYLNRAGLSPDDPNQDGQQDLGDFTDAIPNSVRTQPLDCRVEVTNDPDCPGTPGAGPGGYTFGDFGKVVGFPEVHSDGEIWGETLWDLRVALIKANGGNITAGSDAAEALVTGGLRLSPPNPSFLDERNAILQADTAVLGGKYQDLTWQTFAHRGMGYFASTTDATDTHPVEDFSLPPAADTPTGTVEGTITDAVSGLGVAGADVGVGGQSTPGYDGALAGITDADGHFSFDAPVHTYPAVSVQPGNGYFNDVFKNVAVVAGAPVTESTAVRKSIAVGADITTNDDTGGAYACGVDGLDDGDLGSVWEVDGTNSDGAYANGEKPQATIDLGRVESVTSYGLDPSEGCGSSFSGATKTYKLESSLDGTRWTTVSQGSFTAANSHQLNEVPPPSSAPTARYVRLTMLAAQDPSYGYEDFTELAVFGADANVLPSGTLAGPSSVQPGQTASFYASFTDPDSAITGYSWDFDGDGTIDKTTTGPQVSTTYPTPGLDTVTVRANDFRGGFGSATKTVDVAVAPPGEPTPTQTTAPILTTPPPTAVNGVLPLPTTTTPPPVATPTTPSLAPSVSAASGTKGKARATVTCATGCHVSGTLAVGNLAKRRAHFGSKTLTSVSKSVTGTQTISVKLSRGQRARLRKAHVKTLKASLHLQVFPTGGTRVTRTVSVLIPL